MSGNTDAEVTGICIDSRSIQPGNLFIALRGVATDGHQFIDKAITGGAVAVVCEVLPVAIAAEVVYVQGENSAAAAGIMAHN
ncbi:MAG TPA: Mur ligase domain-containing protein, partial [Niabella sp.]|nr:Mur ligase domain-containing protein [Niabella sp.]